MSEARVKKVSAYPFPVQLKTAAGAYQGQLVKLTLQGFLAEVPISNVQPGETLDVSFSIPVSHAVVNQHCVFRKVYSHWGPTTGGGAKVAATSSTTTATAATTDPKHGASTSKPTPAADSHLTSGSPKAEGLSVLQLVEVHFHPLVEPGRAAIVQFLKMIKQVE